MNNPSASEVDAAIREVLLGVDRSRGAEVFTGRLLGLKQLELRGIEAGEIAVAAGTVVTPLARDYLKRVGVRLRWVSAREGIQERGIGECGFAIEVGSGVTAALRRHLLEESPPWRDLGDSTIAAAHWVAAASDRRAITIVAEASLATWQACQISGVRAATIGDSEAIGRAFRAIAANLLVVEPAGQSIFSLRHLARVLRTRGPAQLREGPIDEDRRGRRPGHALAQPSGLAERALRDRLANAQRGLDRGLFQKR